MKTIEEAAFAIWLEMTSYTAFKEGAAFAQQWIPIEENLPEKCSYIEQKGNYKYTTNVIYKTKNNKFGITRREEFLNHGFIWKGSGSLNSSITHWRPIERV